MLTLGETSVPLCALHRNMYLKFRVIVEPSNCVKVFSPSVENSPPLVRKAALHDNSSVDSCDL